MNYCMVRVVYKSLDYKFSSCDDKNVLICESWVLEALLDRWPLILLIQIAVVEGLE